jgi:lipoprotein-anchoring transpeptidase ErfK/SrfK
MAGRHNESGMTPTTRDPERRLADREARLRRESARVHRQRVVAAVALVAIAVLGTAMLLWPPSSDPGATVASPAPARTTEATVATESPQAAESTASSPATASAPATAALKPLSPAPGVKTIVLDRSEQHVTLYKANGAPVDRFPCATGTYYPLVGTYEVFGHAKQSWSLTDNTTFFYFTKFTESAKGTTIGFHSIPENPDGSLVGGLGKPDSHGCVRLAKDKARFLFTWAPTGTKVVVRK